MNECGLRKAESGIRIGDRLVLRNPQSAFRNPPSAMTLIELLVAVSIVAILATLLLGVAAKAAETAREARTKQLISRLHTLVIDRYESYRLRRVEYSANALAVLQSFPAFTGIPNIGSFSPGQLEAAKRLAAVRELMKMEMPDRWSDVLLDNVADPPIEKRVGGTGVNAVAPTLFVAQRSSLNQLYLRRYNEAVANGVPKETLNNNQNAECLYLIVMNATSDGEAPSLFKESDIGDTDEDGMPEFIDAWGHPIRWLRWAPGFDSDLQMNAASLARVFNRLPDNSEGLNDKEGVEEAIEKNHDPFDLFRVDQPITSTLTSVPMTSALLEGPRAWRLVPLIFSAGPDELTGVRIEVDPDSISDKYLCRTDPYADIDLTISGPGVQWLGEPANTPDAVTDNITNHHITAK